MPINRVLFPAFVKVRDDLLELKRVFLLAQGVQVLVAFPASAGLALVAPELISLMLGDKWLIAVPFVQIFAVASLASAMLSSATFLMITLEHVKALALFTWMQVGLFATLVFWFFPGAGALQIAWLRLLVSGASDILFVALLLRLFAPLRLVDLLRGLVRPLLAVAAMVLTLTAFDMGGLASTSATVALLGKTLLGAAVYSSAVIALWWMSGRPDGAESFLLSCIHRALRKKQDLST